jgi:hypothetical protein
MTAFNRSSFSGLRLGLDARMVRRWATASVPCPTQSRSSLRGSLRVDHVPQRALVIYDPVLLPATGHNPALGAVPAPASHRDARPSEQPNLLNSHTGDGREHMIAATSDGHAAAPPLRSAGCSRGEDEARAELQQARERRTRRRGKR